MDFSFKKPFRQAPEGFSDFTILFVSLLGAMAFFSAGGRIWWIIDLCCLMGIMQNSNIVCKTGGNLCGNSGGIAEKPKGIKGFI